MGYARKQPQVTLTAPREIKIEKGKKSETG